MFSSNNLIKKKVADAVHFPQHWLSIGTAPISHITECLPMDDVSHLLAQSCRFFYHNYKQPIFDQRKPDELAQHIVVKPNQKKMIAMLEHKPDLINAVIKKVVVGEDDFKKIFLNNTIFQLAYGAGDDEMALAMKPFFVTVYGSEEAAIAEMDRQRNEKFAENKEEDEKLDIQAKNDLDALLKPVIEAITQEDFQSGTAPAPDNRKKLRAATLLAIETFREGFAKSQPKIIEKGPHFRDNTLLETYDAYAEAAAQWGYDYNRCALFEDGVLSFVLLYVSRNNAQRFSQGLYYLQNEDKPEPFTRPATLRGSTNNFYAALRGPSPDFVLSGSSVDIFSGGVEAVGGVSPRGGAYARWRRRLIKTYVEQKRQTCGAYAVRQTTTGVLVCNLLR